MGSTQTKTWFIIRMVHAQRGVVVLYVLLLGVWVRASPPVERAPILVLEDVLDSALATEIIRGLSSLQQSATLTSQGDRKVPTRASSRR